MFLRAADYLSTKNLRKYIKRTNMVLEGLCGHISEKEAHAMESRLRGLLPIGCLNKKELRGWTAEKKHEICAGLLNILHGAVNLFEKHTKLPQYKILKFNETVGEVGMITLDCIQADCGIHNDYYNPVAAQTIWEVMFWFDKETEEGRAPFDEYFGFLRREQRAVLEAVSKFSQRTSNHLEARSMRTYLIRRMGVIWNFCRMFSEEICIGIGRPWSELVEDDRKICKALEELGNGRRKRESMSRSEDGRRR
jgi:hypothetical protein